MAVPAALADAPSSTLPAATKAWVDSRLDIAQPDLTHAVVTGELLVYRYSFGGDTYDADELGSTYQLALRTQGASGGDAFVAQLEASARDTLRSSLQSTFPDGTITDVVATVDRATLVAPAGNAYDPPVRFSLSADVARERSALGIATLSDDAIAAAFDAGARVAGDMTLTSEPGYSTTYTIRVPESPAGLVFQAAQGATLAADGRSIAATVDNHRGSGQPLPLDLVVAKAGALAPAAEDLRTTIEIELGELTRGAGAVPIKAHIDAQIRAIGIAERFPAALPSTVELDYVSADALRALHQAGAVTDAQLASASDTMLSTMQASLTRALGEVSATGGFDAAGLALAPSAPFGDEPPVAWSATATGAYAVPGPAGENLDLALLIGGRVNVGFDLAGSAESPTTYILRAPPGGLFAAAPGATLSADGTSATYDLPAGAPSQRAELTLVGADAPTYSQEQADLGIVVDLKDLDITIGGAMGGDMGNLVMDVTVTGKLGVIEVPADLAARLGDRFELDYISSDAIRMLLDRGLISEANMSELESRLLEQVAKNLGGALGGSVPVTGGFDAATLAASRVSSPPSGDDPLVFSARASVLKPLAGGPVVPQTQAAIALYTREQSFTLPRLDGVDTAYTVILPRGFAVTDLTTTGGEAETGKSPDGRDQFTVRPTDEEAKATVAMSVTPTFVMIKFWPLVLFAVLVLVLVVGTPVALVRMRRNKRKQG